MLKKSLFLFALVASALGAPGSEGEGGRVVGGSDAGPAEAPYQASLRTINNNHLCGGAIISSRAVVTAMSCVMNVAPARVLLVVGTTSLNSGGTKYSVGEINKNYDYNSTTKLNDVAVITTGSSIVMSATVSAIPLSHDYIDAGVSVKLTGWGSTSFPSNFPNDLQAITLNTLSVSDCQSKMSAIGPVFSTQLCTLTRVGEGACFRDNGDPSVADGKLVGIISWSTYPCAQGFPDVFTRVSSHIDWIIENSRK